MLDHSGLSGYSIEECHTRIKDGNNHYQDPRNSNRDSGISSSRIQSEQMNRFLTDSKKYSEVQMKINPRRCRDIPLSSFKEKPIKQQSEMFVKLADDIAWNKINLHHRRRSSPRPVLSDLQQEGARTEIQPSRFSSRSPRLTPDDEILQENHRAYKKHEQLPNFSYEEENRQQHRQRRSSQAHRKREEEYHRRPQPRSQSLVRSTSNPPHCYHTTVYQYNCPNCNHHDWHNDVYRRRKLTMEEIDDRVIQNLRKINKDVLGSKKIAEKKQREANEYGLFSRVQNVYQRSY